MARTKGMLNLSGNLEVNAGAPLDARTVVPTLADLTIASNFQYKYVGMPVVVQATGDMYILTANDVTVAANWKQVGSGGGGSSYTAGDGIDISNDEISVKAGNNLSFDSSGNLNATDTTYTAGTNVSISNQNVISATDTTYTAGDGIVIDNDEISTDNMPAADMAEIVTPLPSVMSRLPILFDETGEERIVGWYRYSDGTKKPVYEKSVVDTMPTITDGTTESKTITLSVNVDKCIALYCMREWGTSQYFSPLNDGYPANDSNIYFARAYYDVNNNGVSVSSNRGAFSGKPIYITAYYTKTTDTPV